MSDDSIRDESRPTPADLLSTPEIRERFTEKSSALEAADLVRQMRRVALSVTGVRGISQSELAQRTGLSQPRISQIEKANGRDGITYAVLRKIAYACGIDWGEILREAIAATTSPRGASRPANAFNEAVTMSSESEVPEPFAPAPTRLMSIDDLFRKRRLQARGLSVTDEATEPEIPPSQLPKE